MFYKPLTLWRSFFNSRPIFEQIWLRTSLTRQSIKQSKWWDSLHAKTLWLVAGCEEESLEVKGNEHLSDTKWYQSPPYSCLMNRPVVWTHLQLSEYVNCWDNKQKEVWPLLRRFTSQAQSCSIHLIEWSYCPKVGRFIMDLLSRLRPTLNNLVCKSQLTQTQQTSSALLPQHHAQFWMMNLQLISLLNTASASRSNTILSPNKSVKAGNAD